MAGEFLTDIETLRQRARESIDDGPITDAYKADRERVIEVLNTVLATELVCYLRYKRHYFMASGLNAIPVAQEFLQHATEEQQHADDVAMRITQLRGEPNFDPAGLNTRSHAEYVAGDTLLEMVREDLVAERIAIASYQEIIINKPKWEALPKDLQAIVKWAGMAEIIRMTAYSVDQDSKAIEEL